MSGGGGGGRVRVTVGAVSAALVAFGIVGGSVVDGADGLWVDPVRRGGWLVLKSDFHAHTRMSDGFLSPLELPLVAEREGLHVIGVTEHNWVWPAEIARWFGDLVGASPVVVVGSEITTKRFHVIGLGLTESIDWDQPLTAIVDAIHAQGGVAVAAHPARPFWPAFDPVMTALDASEVMHPIAFNAPGRGNGWNWQDFVDFRTLAAERGNRLAAIGSSDFHFFRGLATFTTYVFAREWTAEAVVEAIRERRTVTYGLAGEPHGDPALAALIAADPLPYRSKDRAYASAGAFDAVARTLGWLGLLGLLLFRRRR